MACLIRVAAVARGVDGGVLEVDMTSSDASVLVVEAASAVEHVNGAVAGDSQNARVGMRAT